MPNQTRTFFKLVNSLGGGKHKTNHSTDLSSFHTEASKLQTEIQVLRKFITETRKDYVDPYRHFSETFRSSMTDKQRDNIESKVQKCFKQLVADLEELKELVVYGNESPDSVESRKGVLMILFQQMDALSSYFQTQRATRMQQEHLVKDKWFSMAEGEYVELLDKSKSKRRKKEKDVTENEENVPVEIKSVDMTFNIPPRETFQEQFPETGTSVMQLQRENRELLEELESKVDQVRIVEKQVVEISTLQDTFSTKVEEQATEIENLHQLAVESTSSVNRAKDLLSEAASKGINFRLFVVVLLITMSIQLFIVHMYN